LDGSFEYCAQDVCPLFKNDGAGLSDKGESASESDDIFTGISKEESKYIELNQDTCDTLPSKLYLNLGYSCNYNCPSCAPAQDEDSNFNKTVDYLEKRNSLFIEKLSRVFSNVRFIFLGSFGEPLYSKSLIRWLKGFRADNFRQDFFIELQTNGSLLNEVFWSGLPVELKKHLSMIQISVDAATKETYEKVRLGGKWEIIKQNLDLTASIPTIESMTLNFVVQEDNFREMPAFVDLGAQLDCQVRFTRVQRWPATSQRTFARLNVFEPSHPSHQELLTILNHDKLKDRRVEMRELIDFVKKKNLASGEVESEVSVQRPEAEACLPGLETKILSAKGQARMPTRPS
jgi:molybdenum cofactor biosynthesis enzyme MoaA